MVDLGTLGGIESEALAVNDRGDIVGYGATADGFHHAVLWKVKPLIATPTDMSFGKVLKEASSDQAIKVKNTGTAPLTISSIGSPAPPFSIAGGTCTAPQVLPSGGSCTIVVRFSPTAQETASSSFNITSNNPVEDSLTVHLSGRGVILLAKPDEVTIGSEVTITGAGFGTSKGNVLIGAVALKITEWTEREIKGTLSKAPTPDVLSNVVVQPKVPKGTPAITEPAGFTARGPKTTSVDPGSGISGGPSPIAIHGNLFSTKKGKVTLDPGSGGKVKSCKVLSWAMEEIKFLVPKGLTAGTDYTLGVSNSVGSDTRTFGIAAP